MNHRDRRVRWLVRGVVCVVGLAAGYVAGVIGIAVVGVVAWAFLATPRDPQRAARRARIAEEARAARIHREAQDQFDRERELDRLRAGGGRA